MITHVKYLIEELQRFSPDARLRDAVEVSGYSPSTECVVEVLESASEIERLNDEIESLKESLNSHQECFKQIKEAIEKDDDDVVDEISRIIA